MGVVALETCSYRPYNRIDTRLFSTAEVRLRTWNLPSPSFARFETSFSKEAFIN